MSTKRTVADHMMRGHPGMMAAVDAARDRRGTLRRIGNYLSPDKYGLLGILLLVALTSALSLITPNLMRRAIDDYITAKDLGNLARTVGLMALIYVLAVAGSWAQSIWMIRITQRAIRNIRRDLFDKLQILPLRYFDARPHGELMSRLTNDTDLISNALGESIIQFISSMLLVTGALIIMFGMNWRLTLVSFVTLPFVLVVTWLIGRATRTRFIDRQQALGELNGLIEETINGQRVVKICRHEAAIRQQFTTHNQALKHTGLKALIVIGLMGPVMQVFRNIGFAILVSGGIWMVTLDLATVGTIAAFLTYSDYFNRPIHQLANLYGSIQSALAGAERVFAVLDEAPEPADAPEALELAPVRGKVEFVQVDFSYVPGVQVLSEVSFHAEAGQTVALVGATGAGKTTMINLLTRLYDIDAGAISIDGYDIRNLRLASLRRSLGIVLQDTILFADTVRENIRYGRLEASDAEVEAAARLADAESFIVHLPHGYDTVLSDAGGSLSQGQRQLIAIARIMLADPSILILDEATSSVDTRTELHVQKAMYRLMQGRTSLVIAHRLSTIRQADRILVLDHGRVVEQGTHADLLEQQDAYYRLYHGQMSVAEESSA